MKGIPELWAIIIKEGVPTGDLKKMWVIPEIRTLCKDNLIKTMNAGRQSSSGTQDGLGLVEIQPGY